ncbi:hypothetical protein TPHA_0P00230 [Tetrapisispora phaffii CBS 4417]|uniref:DUF726 domain-containing protein n=1 Tax=Tetrapisispora phaffii (strain ATCC 24235 / CBS 4417 / NBRC 1672 / NRRL Y-8282 / UCD 70-5) TaxID=1071381 RepID=G8C203_TETPH|nr:hypothetical protein TPHA_0P00230 [Tetrapisispora phaffii CBS 4417]CCE66181.1 hypothetical protein TPHA_0P00230 [Tetrapisispora phaffii CBS 4417]
MEEHKDNEIHGEDMLAGEVYSNAEAVTEAHELHVDGLVLNAIDKNAPNDDNESGDEKDWQPIDKIPSEDDTLRCADSSGSNKGYGMMDNDEEVAEDFIYSNVSSEEQIIRSNKNNSKTDFLFNNPNVYVTQDKKESVDAEDNRETKDGNHSSISINYYKQLAYTRSLFSDNQKFGYVGSLSVLTGHFCLRLAKLATIKNLKTNQKLTRLLSTLQKDLADWRSKILNMLYEELELSSPEIKMIEQLDMIDVQLSDLCRNLQTTQKNEPEEGDDKNTSKENTIDIAWVIICHLFLLLTSEESYDSRDRTLLVELAKVLGISYNELNDFERRAYDAIVYNQDSSDDQSGTEIDHLKKRRHKNKKKKMAYVGLAMVGGSVVLGLSGGLLAPFIGAGLASGFSTLGLGGAAGFLSSAAGTASVAITSTAVGANIGAKSMSKRMGSVETFEIKPIHDNSRVNVLLTVPGWMINEEDEISAPFSTIDCIEGDIFSLNWEPSILTEIGTRMKVATSEVVTDSIQQMLGNVILVSIVSAIQLPLILSRLSFFLDNPWAVASDRAWSAGLILADTLMNKNLGNRPVTLIGYSLGARVIYSCLLELSAHKKVGLVENVFLFGAPVIISQDELIRARSMVSGRFVSGYSLNDWILKYIYRTTTSRGYKEVLGISQVDEPLTVENIDLTEIIKGHSEYRENMPKLLKLVGLEVTSETFHDPANKEDAESHQISTVSTQSQDPDSTDKIIKEIDNIESFLKPLTETPPTTHEEENPTQ